MIPFLLLSAAHDWIAGVCAWTLRRRDETDGGAALRWTAVMLEAGLLALVAEAARRRIAG